MIFTATQIEALLSIVDYHSSFLIGFNLGVDALNEYDKFVLQQHGIDINTLNQDWPPYLQSFMWGRLSAKLSDKQAETVTYDDFSKYLKRGQYIPLSDREKNEYEIARKSTYDNIKSFTGKMRAGVGKAFIEEDQKTSIDYAKLLKEELSTGVLDRKSLQNIVSELGTETQDWSLDWGRIVDTEMNNIFQKGRAETIIQDKGFEAEVYKDVYELACKHCIRLLLTGGIGSQPIVFKMSELIANGSNYGKKVEDWKATVDGIHPFCFDKETEVLTKEDGWKKWPDVTGKEVFLSVDPNNGNMEWVRAAKLIKYRYNGKMNYFKGFAFDLMTTPNHKHFTKSKTGIFRLRDLTEFVKTEMLVNTGKNWTGCNVKIKTIGKYNLNFDDYCNFMGWWLSDGSISKPKNAGWQLKITQHKEYNKEDIRKISKKCFGRTWEGEEATYCPIDEETAKFFTDFGHAYYKFIPEDIKESSTNNIRLFMDSFVRGDGCVRVNNNNKNINSKPSIYYTTSSPKLANDLGELIIKMGYRPSYFVTKPKPTVFKNGTYTAKHDQITIYQNRSKTTVVSKLDIKDVEYNDFVYDVELEKYHTLFVKRKGKVCVSGNCRCTLREKLPSHVWNEESGTFTTPEKYKRKIERKSKVKITIGDRIIEA